MRVLLQTVVVLLLAACARVPVAAPPEVTAQPSAQHDAPPQPESEPEDPEARFARILERLKPAIAAFRRQDAIALSAWIEASDDGAERTLGALMLVRMRAPGAQERFVEAFPAKDAAAFGRLWDVQGALSLIDFDFEPLRELTCGALEGWPGALERLIESHGVTDASATTDHHCGLLLLAGLHPERVLTAIVRGGVEEPLRHACVEEATSAGANALHARLSASSFSDSEAEALRVELLPLLKRRAAEDVEHTACEHVRCPKPPQTTLHVDAAAIRGTVLELELPELLRLVPESRHAARAATFPEGADATPVDGEVAALLLELGALVPTGSDDRSSAIRLSLHRPQSDGVEARVHIHYASEQAAIRGMAELRAWFTGRWGERHMRFLGLYDTFEQASLTRERSTLQTHLSLTPTQTRILLRALDTTLRTRFIQF